METCLFMLIRVVFTCIDLYKATPNQLVVSHPPLPGFPPACSAISSSTIQKYTASIFGHIELVILVTISCQTCDFDDHYSPKMPPARINFSSEGGPDEKQVFDLEWPNKVCCLTLFCVT